MQSDRTTGSKTTGAPHRDAAGADFDFGSQRPARRTGKPGIIAALVAFAFAISMFMPLPSKAESPRRNGHGEVIELPPEPKSGGFIKRDDRGGGAWGNKGWDQPNWSRDKVRVPSVCAVQIEGRDGGFRWYSASCMRNYGIRGNLPHNCALQASIFGQRDQLFPADCLRRAGYDLRNY
ncbi:hypothetical protein HOY34_03925 [Xinfangfangia sp. D13-10-4-6]|uniref:hypothetical protein n=1 Tax=Pseudogemmobacter hezensis TaxID=2737662 RepID=UPI0015536693|nr:hypothetical protein [Pseudogemmobacter hezensis]NPD14348.1 hypothetical protein [Pseudogemmobacter hezensis]